MLPSRLRLSHVIACALACVPLALAADWPQWRGPERTGLSRETGLAKSWPKDGPRLVWQIKDAGAGFSGPAISNGLLFTMGNRGEGKAGREYVLCYDLKDGKQKWAVDNGPAYVNSYGDGPRCTPTVDGDVVYALGASGDLCCLRVANGSAVWRKNILREFQANNIRWGISESPLVDGELLIVTPGGKKGTMVALNKKDGRTVWTSHDPAGGREQAGYASPIVFTVNGVRQYATFTEKGAYGVRARDGKFLWRYDNVANSTANIATPIFHNDHIFYSSDYGTGCALLRLESTPTRDGGATKATEVYFNKEMKNHHGGIVLLNGYLYGFNSAILTCMKWETGAVAWRDRSVGKGSLTYADGMLYVLSEGGVMGLVEARSDRYVEVSRFRLPDRSSRPSWTHPVVSNGRLYLRDQNNLFCYDVSGK